MNAVNGTANIKQIKIVKYSKNSLDMNEFENMWDEDEPVEETPPEYLLKEGIAKYNILCNILSFYYHAKHGEPLTEVFAPTNDEIMFNLK